MEFIAEELDIVAHTPTLLLNEADAEELGVHPLERVQITADGRTSVGVVEVTAELVDEGTVGVTKQLGHLAGPVEVTLASKPESVSFITKKLRDVELERRELDAIVTDIDRDRLDDVELAAFVSGTYAHGLSREEILGLTEAMVDVGETMTWDNRPIADKHSIGGVAGNRVTPIVVSIAAAGGLTIPKTSSRAVTSAAGTADTMEVFCEVEFSVAEIREIVDETGGCLVWGGGVNLSPVDDEIIRVENPLSIDPPGQVIASVLSKKRSAGSTHVVIDIPYGEGVKVESLAAARELAEDFDRVGEHLGMAVECAITRGDVPVGRGIGPVLEARDVLEVLANEGPNDLRIKSIRIAEMLFEACDVDGDPTAILESGRALERFRDILAAQNGDPDVAAADLEPGDERTTVEATRSGVVTHIDNRMVNEIARRAGAPKDKGAGLEFHNDVADAVEVGDPLFTVYAENAEKLSDAISRAEAVEAMRVRSRDEALVERF